MPTIRTTKNGREYTHKNIYLTPDDLERLNWLSVVNKCNPSAYIRKLIQQEYAILKYVQQRKNE